MRPCNSDLIALVITLCIVGCHGILTVNDKLKDKASVLVLCMLGSNIEAR